MQISAPEDAIRHWHDGLQDHVKSGPFLVAVSGGSDSLALLNLLLTLKAERGFALFAVTVDHRLRPEAAREAQAVAGFCAAKDIPYHIAELEWELDEKVSQARARTKRYLALASAARQISARLILTGHTLDDQMETFLIRSRAGSDWPGLAGMQVFSPLPVWPEGEGLAIARPLISTLRQALRDHLARQGLGWVDDPSNQNPAYERGRMRKLLANDDGLQKQILIRQPQLHDDVRAMDKGLLDWVQAHATWQPGGSVSLPLGAFAALEPAWQERLTGRLLSCVSGREGLPRSDGIRAFLWKHVENGARGVSTLSGCRIEVSAAEIEITPEIMNADGMSVSARQPVWEGRVRFDGFAGEEVVHFQPWGEKPVPSELKIQDLPAFHARKGLPVAQFNAGTVSGVPHLGFNTHLMPVDLAKSRLEFWLDTACAFSNE